MKTVSFSTCTAVTVPGPGVSVSPEDASVVWVPEPNHPGTVDLPERRSVAVFRTKVL